MQQIALRLLLAVVTIATRQKVIVSFPHRLPALAPTEATALAAHVERAAALVKAKAAAHSETPETTMPADTVVERTTTAAEEVALNAAQTDTAAVTETADAVAIGAAVAHVAAQRAAKEPRGARATGEALASKAPQGPLLPLQTMFAVI